MQWKEPSERTQFILLSPILIPVTIVAVPVFAPLIAVLWAWDRWGPKPAWRKWFAWRPVKVFSWTTHEHRWVWLEWLERWSGIHTNADYRFPGDE